MMELLLLLISSAISQSPVIHIRGPFSPCALVPEVALREVLSQPDAWTGKLVRARGLLITDFKEFEFFRAGEDSNLQVPLSYDAISERYLQLFPAPPGSFSARDDFEAKVREREGSVDASAVMRYPYYRREASVCGRLIKDGRDYSFTDEDIAILRSYLLPYPLPRRGTSRAKGSAIH